MSSLHSIYFSAVCLLMVFVCGCGQSSEKLSSESAETLKQEIRDINLKLQLVFESSGSRDQAIKDSHAILEKFESANVADYPAPFSTKFRDSQIAYRKFHEQIKAARKHEGFVFALTAKQYELKDKIDIAAMNFIIKWELCQKEAKALEIEFSEYGRIQPNDQSDPQRISLACWKALANRDLKTILVHMYPHYRPTKEELRDGKLPITNSPFPESPNVECRIFNLNGIRICVSKVTNWNSGFPYQYLIFEDDKWWFASESKLEEQLDDYLPMALDDAVEEK